jgi:DNA-binding SARP family transcriptional activator
LQFGILGPLQVLDRGEPLPLGGPKQRLLLALLLLRAGEVVSSDRLIDDLWGDDPPPTATAALQVHISNLRRALDDADALITRAPGYLMQPGDALDLRRFERLLGEAEIAETPAAAPILHRALALWRGPPLDDLAYEQGLQAAIARLEEFRVAALERRIEVDLALGRHAALVPELEELAREHPFRETLHRQLMLALYRSNRQAEALAAFRTLRTTLADELGLEPGADLRRLEQAILTQDSSLALETGPVSRPPDAPLRSLLLILGDAAADEALVALGRLLAGRIGSEVVLLRVLDSQADLAAATADLNARRSALLADGVAARAAAFAAADANAYVARFATRLDVALALSTDVDLLAAPVPCDSAVLFPRGGDVRAVGPVLAPFGGGEHDWAAVELAAWVAVAGGVPLRLAGSAGREDADQDASPAIADASLAVQYALGVTAEPLLLDRAENALRSAAEDAGLLVLGLPERWRTEGIGAFRLELARSATPPVLLVRRGVRPGGLSPHGSMTRFTWSLGPAGRPTVQSGRT